MPPPLLRRLLLLLFFAFCVALSAQAQGPSSSGSFTGRVLRVDSGDEVVMRLDTWQVTVHLHGISCPKDPPELAERARQFTERRVLGTMVQVRGRGTGLDQTIYGDVIPALSYPVSAARRTLNQELTEAGLATWVRNYAPGRTDLAECEAVAQSQKRGLWADVPTGADIPLPPAAASVLQASPPKPTPKPATTPSPTPTPSPTATPRPTPSPALLTAEPAAAPTATTRPRPWIPGIMGFVGLAAFVGTLLLLGHISPPALSLPALPFTFFTALLAAGAASLLVRLPCLATFTPYSLHDTRTLIAALTTPLAVLCGWYALHLCGREQQLRAIPPLSLADAASLPTPETAPNRIDGILVRLTGRADADALPAVSQTGHIAGIYVRETTQQFQAPPDGKPGLRPRPGTGAARRRTSSYRWHTAYKETQGNDFCLVDDTTGAMVRVEGKRAHFFPLRIARFYNEVPVERWFDRPYADDTRSEVHFIPLHAEVTVWGRLFPPSAPGAMAHVEFDRANRMLEVVEGDGARLLSGTRPLIGLLLTLVGMALVLAALSTATPIGGFVAAITLFWTGLLLLLWLAVSVRRARHLAREVTRIRTELLDAFARRRERLTVWRDTLRDAGLRDALVLESFMDAPPTDFDSQRRISDLWDSSEAQEHFSTERFADDATRESQIADLREDYADALRAVTTARQTFPGGLVTRAILPGDPD